MSAKNKPNELYLTRVYDAPVKAVWDAWTTPEQIAHWYGPRGFTLTTKKMDVRTGGSWSYIMHGPDGTDYDNKTQFLEVEKYKRMVYDHGGNDEAGKPPIFRVTVNFSESAGKTRMEMTMALPSAEAAQETKKFIKQAGGDSTWDRLAEYVAADESFVINRSFEVSRERMFTMWTDPQHFSQWLPPTGFTMEQLRADIRTGGSNFYCMSHPTGTLKMYGKIFYEEITAPERLVYTQIFCDENEKISRHPMEPNWPERMRTTVTLTEEAPDRTRVRVVWKIEGQATAQEREVFNKAKAGMTQGWTGSFDKLEAYLER